MVWPDINTTYPGFNALVGTDDNARHLIISDIKLYALLWWLHL